MNYISDQQSMYRQYPNEVEQALQIITNRYIGEQPRHSVVYRAFNRQGFIRDLDYRYHFDLGARYPELKEGQYVYAWAKIWAEQPISLGFSLSCFGPIAVFLNGERVFKSNLNDDVFPDRRTGFRTKLEQGWNHFVLRFTSTPTGCGGWFGTGSIKGFPLHFIVPSQERSGQEGWIFSSPLDEEMSLFPSEGMSEQETGIRWYPDRQWTADELAKGVFGRLFGTESGQTAYAWSKLHCHAPYDMATWSGRHQGSMTIWIDDKLVYEADNDGHFQIPLPQGYEACNVLIRSSCRGQRWGFEADALPQGYELKPPALVEGSKAVWFYVGPLDPDLAPEQVCTMEKLFTFQEGATYWQTDEPDTWIRPYMENALFGKWNYPLGVTLYGILQTGLQLNRADYVQYVMDHIELCTAFDAYALWDKEQYGAAGVNHQLSAIDTLDDCGSFAATTLTVMKHQQLRGGREAVDRVAHYITHVQDRLPDGALYRVRGSTDFMMDTMWCDDLYMSTPFLCKYYELTGDESYLRDAARQFLLYKKYLYLPEQQIMSHVYDFKFNKPTLVPWGRGNGWVLFSLTELLAVLPEDHEMRPELLQFFRDLCEGYLRLQSDHGMWHQVLTDPESYAETSCTSMFIYAFTRGVRYGWLVETKPYIEAARKGWEGMVRHAIDKFGNVYGVCKGSGYSFSTSYYKDSLGWNLNDTHGIGIVLLAGVELMNMLESLKSDR